MICVSTWEVAKIFRFGDAVSRLCCPRTHLHCVTNSNVRQREPPLAYSRKALRSFHSNLLLQVGQKHLSRNSCLLLLTAFVTLHRSDGVSYGTLLMRHSRSSPHLWVFLTCCTRKMRGVSVVVNHYHTTSHFILPET